MLLKLFLPLIGSHARDKNNVNKKKVTLSLSPPFIDLTLPCLTILTRVICHSSNKTHPPPPKAVTQTELTVSQGRRGFYL